MINNVRNTVLAVINKDNNGYITPDEFNVFAKQAQLEIFEEYFTGYALASQKQNVRVYGSEYAGIMKRIEDVIDLFSMPSTGVAIASGSYALPSNLYRLNHLAYNTNTKIEKVSQNKALLLLNSDRTTPTTTYPVYTLSGNSAKIYPASITSGVTVNYIRYPEDPKWTYTLAPGSDAPLFNPAANDYQDFELPLSDEMNLIVRILQMAGISIREEQVVQAAKSEEIQDKQE